VERFRAQHADADVVQLDAITMDTDRQEEMHGLHFAYYDEEQLRAIAELHYEVIQIEWYAEMEADDSLYILLRKRPASSSNE
jgi:hypothetical protein